jgi:hypothetical protein
MSSGISFWSFGDVSVYRQGCVACDIEVFRRDIRPENAVFECSSDRREKVAVVVWS